MKIKLDTTLTIDDEEKSNGRCAAYIELYPHTKETRVGTIEVKGLVKYRKNASKNFNIDMLLLDFDMDGRLCGVEILDEERLPIDIDFKTNKK